MSVLQQIIIIAAMSQNRVIGKDNDLPWSIKENLAYFKERTLGWPCIMGRKTWESLPKKPLPGRLNIIVSNSYTQRAHPAPKFLGAGWAGHADTQINSEGDFNTPKNSLPPGCPQDNLPQCPSVKIFKSIFEAIEYCADYEKIFICGGESIYKQAMPLANKIDLSIIPGLYDGDTFFPEIDSAIWTKSQVVSFDNFSVITYNAK